MLWQFRYVTIILHLMIITPYFAIVLKLLKHIVLFFLTIGLCLPDSWLHHIVGFPFLAAHYYHHITEHEEIGVIEFLVLHSSDSNHMKTDAHEHEHLPCSKDAHGCQHAPLVPVVIQNTEIALMHPIELCKIQSAYFLSIFPENNAGSIWQPPKIA